MKRPSYFTHFIGIIGVFAYFSTTLLSAQNIIQAFSVSAQQMRDSNTILVSGEHALVGQNAQIIQIPIRNGEKPLVEPRILMASGTSDENRLMQNPPTNVGGSLGEKNNSLGEKNGSLGEKSGSLRENSASRSPSRLASTESIIKNHRLQNRSSSEFGKILTEKLSSRFVPVNNVEASSGLSRFRFPAKDQTELELSLDHQNGIVTVIGTLSMVESAIKMIQLIDSPPPLTGNQTVFAAIDHTPLPSLKEMAIAVNRSSEAAQKVSQNQSQNLSQNLPPFPARNITNQNTSSPSFTENSDAASARFVAPNSEDSNANRSGGNQDAASRSPNSIGGGIVGPVQVDIVDDLGTMVVRGPAEDVTAILKMFEQIETMSIEYDPLIEMVEMKHADSYRVYMMVQQLYNQVYLQRRGSITMLPLIKPNTIMLVGKKESIETAKELIEKLDIPVSPNSEYLIIKLKNAAANTLQTQISSFFANPNQQNQGLESKIYVVSDYRTNSLIVQGSPRDLTTVADMVRKLDSEGSDAKNTVKTFSLKNAMATELATTLQNAISGTTTGTGGFGGGGAANSQNGTRSPTLVKIDGEGLLEANVLLDVRITADSRSNTLIVSAPTETMPLIEALIKELDQLPSAESQIKIFTLVNGDASALTTVLQNLFAASSSSTGGGGFGGGGTQTSQIATVRPGIEEGESTLVSVRFQTDTRT
ncbi:MAG: secretin N-terminal domain-containing protein, partial [Thermoguttaceae bacterium]